VRRVTLDQAAKRPTSLADLRLPPLGDPIWSAFWRIEQSRQGGYGPQAFTYVELEAWTRLADETLAPWEVEGIMAMDVARREALSADKPEAEAKPAGMRRLVRANSKAAEAMFDRFGEVRDA
jgi:hypothetical protein